MTAIKKDTYYKIQYKQKNKNKNKKENFLK